MILKARLQSDCSSFRVSFGGKRDGKFELRKHLHRDRIANIVNIVNIARGYSLMVTFVVGTEGCTKWPILFLFYCFYESKK